MQIWKLVLCIAICQGAGLIGSWFTSAAIPNWYETLVKPPFTPPGWFIGLVWVVLYTLMGIALYLVWRKNGIEVGVIAAMVFFFVQLALNILWSIVFFGFRYPLGGIYTIVVLWIFIVITIIKFFPIDRVAGYLLVPYLIWVSFASVLNAYIVRLNT
ncbi:MAG: tryptophan-rich sensory protein [Candidatus Atribacteria bacterium]|nr:tryptophan-rich sensory protein [Candidatus Atribacteria bacterium]